MKTIIYAHRGASKQAPENTIPAFDLAYQQGADGIETDVHLTKDQIPILMHDEQLQRTTNGTGFIKDFTYEELTNLDAGSWKNPRYQGTKIPTLEDLLTWNQDKQLKLNIELKNKMIDYPNIEEIVYQKLVDYQMVEASVISSFNHQSIARISQLQYPIDYCLLSSKQAKALIIYSKELKAAGIHIRYRLLNNQIIKQAQGNNLYVAVYTINQPFMIRRAFKLGCHAIFTDVPRLANRIRKATQH
ncbi:glycerophosphodiester phosphodiesterase [Gracilibacillus alcaliphilus]|uniref:glycerophosphodiester phosphodiesterase n=1 Tax=Gracilibacillus alcaliphilus TaxID=1401441 RepID=UPI00195E4B7B|nr:glycerophosphodiester phosphodiesterase family protein [Gracilibacillus alcaliphilus]MBM7675102.1 glycerophosphoryl diester phosphodiesterase [Gracilibacillus alcaliphilus]